MMRVNSAGADWLLLKGMINSEIDKSRSLLESPLDVERTSHERGRISAFRFLLDQVEPEKTPETKDVDYGFSAGNE